MGRKTLSLQAGRKFNNCTFLEVSRWLGHKSITTTVDLYGHLVPEATRRARDALDSAFGRAQAHVPGMCPALPPRDITSQVRAA